MSKKKVVTSGGVEVREKPLGLRIWNNRGYRSEERRVGKECRL